MEVLIELDDGICEGELHKECENFVDQAIKQMNITRVIIAITHRESTIPNQEWQGSQ